MDEAIRNRILGSVIAGAAGDALGYPVEFTDSYSRIVAQYGPDGITGYDNDAYCDKAQVSDDTQMTLYTIAGICKASSENFDDVIDYIRQSYVVWMCRQTGVAANTSFIPDIAGVESLNKRRAPGITCLNALDNIRRGIPVVNNSKGCGSIMRIAPVGLYAAAKRIAYDRCAELASEVALITHKHPMSTLSSAVCAVLIQHCAENVAPMSQEGFCNMVRKALDVTKQLYSCQYPNYTCELERICLEALDFKDDKRLDWEIIEHSIGEGWVAEETLTISLFCVARHINNVEKCLIAAVNHGGNSDSTGAVAGNIIGAILGFDAIPESLCRNLQDIDILKKMAELLVE